MTKSPTGRLAKSEPNTQGIPVRTPEGAKIREAFTAAKSDNDLECERIAAMSEAELLDYVIAWPENLTDPYYRQFGKAIQKRYLKLRK